MDAFKTNRELVVDDAQPACSAMTVTLYRMNAACLRKSAEDFETARKDFRRALADLQAAMDLLVDPTKQGDG